MQNDQQTPLWNALIIVSIMLGALVTVMTIFRHDLLPSLYADSHAEQAPVEESTVVKQDTVMHKAPRERDSIKSEAGVPGNVQDPAQFVSRKYLLIAGSFISEENAVRYIEQLKMSEIHASIHKKQDDPVPSYRVVVSSSDSWVEIKNAKALLESKGWHDCWIFKQQ